MVPKSVLPSECSVSNLKEKGLNKLAQEAEVQLQLDMGATGPLQPIKEEHLQVISLLSWNSKFQTLEETCQMFKERTKS
jgi:hypothetical protein